MSSRRKLVDAIVLAAGSSSRLGQPKQLVRINETTLLAKTIAAVNPSVQNVIVVIGAYADQMRLELKSAPIPKLKIVQNHRWAEGVSTSLLTALDAVQPETEAVLITVCDQPYLTDTHFANLIDQWQSKSDGCTATGYAGTIGVPAIIPKPLFCELRKLRGDRGAQQLLHSDGNLSAVVKFEPAAVDVDLPDDLRQFHVDATVADEHALFRE